MYPDTYEKIIYDLCKKHHIDIEKISDESIYKLTHNNHVHFIWSRRFDLNSTIASRIADNKYATYKVLNASGIDTVPCYKVSRIDTEDYFVSHLSISEICTECLLKYKSIVIKPNNSYEGMDVYKCSCLKDVEKTLYKIEKKYKNLVISPYINAQAEYRLFFLNQHILYAYKKIKNHIICDGSSTIVELLVKNNVDISKIDSDIYKLFNITYPIGYKFELNWKFNLSQGANCISIDDPNLYKELSNIAIAAATAINIKFATVDILVDEYNNKYVLEINAGVAMDQFIIKYPDGLKIASSIYEQALISMFDVI